MSKSRASNFYAKEKRSLRSLTELELFDIRPLYLTLSICFKGCKIKPCPDDQIYLNNTFIDCVPKSICKHVCLERDGITYYEGDLIDGDECSTCHCSRKLLFQFEMFPASHNFLSQAEKLFALDPHAKHRHTII